MTSRISFLILVLLVLIVADSRPVSSQRSSSFDGFQLVDKDGNIRKPADYRDRYELLGTYMVLDPQGNQMHVTYASPGTAAYYRRTGKFPDGCVMVKEIFGTDHAKLTTGDAHWASGIQVWFVQIKDEKHRYPNNPLWGDGWGVVSFQIRCTRQAGGDGLQEGLPRLSCPRQIDRLDLHPRLSGAEVRIKLSLSPICEPIVGLRKQAGRTVAVGM